MHFSTYGLGKKLLDKCLKSPCSEDLSTSNVLNGLKNCSELNGSTLTIFIDPCGRSLR